MSRPEEDAPSVDDVHFDKTKLEASASAERGDLFLLNWLSGCEKALEKLPESVIQSEQANLTTSLLSLITPPLQNSTTPTVKPGRPARALISRILLLLLKRGNSKGLFDLAQSLLKGTIGNDYKGAPEKEKEWRIACAYCLGELYSVYGNQVMSLYIEIMTVMTRLYKTTSFPVILRYSSLMCLKKVIEVAAKSMSDQHIKETLKSLRGGLNEKAGAIIRGTADCLLALSSAPGTYSTLSEIDNILTPAFKSLETADFVTRRSLSRLIAGILAATQVEGSAPPPPAAPKKKNATKEGEEEDDVYPEIGAPSAAEASTKTLLSPIEMLVQLSAPYNRSSSSNRLRNAIIDVYAELFKNLGSSWVEHYYPELVKHVIDEIGCGAAAGLGWIGWNARAAERTEPSKARHDALAARKAVAILLSDVVSGQLLSEAGQIVAAREIGTLYLKKWPSLMPTQPPPSKQSLLIALEETSSILRSLGCAPPAVQEALYDPLVRLVSHPSHSVQISAAWALRTFCNAAPTRLSSTIVHIVDLLNKDLSTISSKGPSPSTTEIHRRVVGYSHSLAALINLIPHKPLYVSFDLSAKCMSLAIQLLKQSGNHELHISGVEIQVAWILVSALMSLGPNFVRLHLPQLLLLWRNALPKPTSKDASAAQVRGDNEWAFLLHIRECTLSAILSFLRHNGPSASTNGGNALVTDDIAKRLVLLLSNGLSFANSFTTSHPSIATEQSPATSSRLQLVDRDIMFRRRLLQCFVAFGQSPATQPYQIPLLQQVVALFTDSDKYFGESALQASASAGTFTSIWDETDGLGYGVTSLMRDGANDVAGGDDSTNSGTANSKLAKLNRDAAEAKIEGQLKVVILQAAEHDSLVLSSKRASEPAGFDPLPEAPPPAVGLIDAGIELFALYFSLQESPNQNALLQIMINNHRSFKLEKNPGRKMAILANSITALVGSLRHSRRAIEAHQVAGSMRDIIKDALLHSDASLRQAAAESLGRLSGLGGTTFMAAQIQFCVQQVVSNTDPDNRAGCALAFSEIYSHVGSLAAGPVLKTIVDVLLSLSADPHPLVHFSALRSLSHVIDAASLSYAPFTNNTLGLLCKLYMQDTHEPEGGTAGSVNLRGDLPAYQSICRVLDALIGVLGPELQESERVRQLVLILLKELTLEKDDGISVEAIKATQHFLIFAPATLDHTTLVSNLRSQLSSSKQPLKVAAVNSVYQLVQRDAALMSKLGGDGLVRELFALLDDDPSIEGVRDAIMSWLRQTADANPSGWIDLCQRIMSRSAGTANVKVDSSLPAGGLADEESQGLGLEAEGGARPGAANARTSSRWRTQLFALECLHEVFVTVVKSGRREHFDIARARAVRANKKGLLITRVSDLIKMAFTASTAQVMEIRLEGLVVLKDVIDNFGQSQDIDFEEALLLDQFQAPIAAALTPAFSADSYPEVLASAIQVCAVFVGSGVVKEIEKMGRILKLLTTALESCKDSDMNSLGDVKDLSSTAAVMLKTSIFAAWAQFQTASVRQPYLADVIRPHLPLLCPFWVASLREYARVRTDPDAASTSDSGAGGAAFDSVYSGLSRETALPFYERAWPQMLHAVATLLKASDPHMLLAMDGNSSSSSPSSSETNSTASLPSRHRSEPALFFWVTFGLSFEALCSSPPSGSTPASTVQSIALEAVVGLIRPDIAGNALKDTSLFDEVCNLCYRLAITEGIEIKMRVLEIALGLIQVLIKEVVSTSANGANSDQAVIRNDPKLTQCLRVATTALRESIPATSSSAKPTANNLQRHVMYTRAVFSLYCDIADVFPSPMREELYAISFHFFSLLLKDEKLEVDIVGPSLPVLKALCDRSLRSTNEGSSSMIGKVLNGMMSACLMNIDEMRGRKSPSAIRKTKNNLLATVLLITALPNQVKIGKETVEHACYLITETALEGDEGGEASTTALHCLVSLLVAASRSRGSGILSFCIGQLLPGVIELVARAAEDKGGAGYNATSDTRYRSLEEVLKGFVAVLSNVAVEHRTRSLSILLPTLNLLLSPSVAPPRPIHSLALSYLLQLAQNYSGHFKEAMGALGEEERRVLEESLRGSVQGRGRGEVGVGGRTMGGGGGEEKKKIELKLF